MSQALAIAILAAAPGIIAAVAALIHSIRTKEQLNQRIDAVRRPRTPPGSP